MARTNWGPDAMQSAEPDVTTTQGEETVVHSRTGFTPPTPAELAARFPNLEVIELLGHGGMGIVYKGRQTFLDRLVAIKVLRPDLQTDDAFQQRFLREARTLAKLRHPFIVTVFDVLEAQGLYCLVMEYVEGASLRQLLAEGSVTQRDVLDFVPQMTEALQHAHEAGVVHRDIKPENVLVDSLGRVRLVDFGLATLFRPEAPASGPDDDRVVGTFRYMAPEQITMPEAVDHRADIYSTGVVCYEMLTRELPGPDRVPPSQRAATDPRLDPIVLRAVERERDRRYQEARLMHLDITNLSRTPESTIRIEKYIPAPPAQVFTLWTDPGQMADWLAPSDDFGPTIGEVDPHVGGHYRIGMLLPGQQDRKFVSGQYCRMDAPGTLSFTWAWEPHTATTRETQVTLEFHPKGDGTDLVLTHERFRDKPERNGHAHGWRGCLDRLGRKFGG
jgi:serine/threonine protein kinase